MSTGPTSTAAAISALFTLSRPVNMLVAFVGVAASCVIAGAREADASPILLASLSAVLATAAGNVINDYFDVEIDRVNKPWRPLPAGRLRPSTAALTSALSACAALALTIPLGSAPILIMGGSLVLMYLYSARLKRVPLLGNVIVATVNGAAFIYGATVFGNPAAGLVPAGFALLFNLAREILKDVEDMRGDHAGEVRTFPLRAGERPALLLVSLLLILLILSTFLPLYFDLYGPAYLWVVVFGVDCFLLYVLFAMWNDRSTMNIRRLNVLLKFDMLAGIAAILLGSVL